MAVYRLRLSHREYLTGGKEEASGWPKQYHSRPSHRHLRRQHSRSSSRRPSMPLHCYELPPHHWCRQGKEVGGGPPTSPVDQGTSSPCQRWGVNLRCKLMMTALQTLTEVDIATRAFEMSRNASTVRNDHPPA
jgi:hypothetical protein